MKVVKLMPGGITAKTANCPISDCYSLGIVNAENGRAAGGITSSFSSWSLLFQRVLYFHYIINFRQNFLIISKIASLDPVAGEDEGQDQGPEFFSGGAEIAGGGDRVKGYDPVRLVQPGFVGAVFVHGSAASRKSNIVVVYTRQ